MQDTNFTYFGIQTGTAQSYTALFPNCTNMLVKNVIINVDIVNKNRFHFTFFDTFRASVFSNISIIGSAQAVSDIYPVGPRCFECNFTGLYIEGTFET